MTKKPSTALFTLLIIVYATYEFHNRYSFYNSRQARECYQNSVSLPQMKANILGQAERIGNVKNRRASKPLYEPPPVSVERLQPNTSASRQWESPGEQSHSLLNVPVLITCWLLPTKHPVSIHMLGKYWQAVIWKYSVWKRLMSCQTANCIRTAGLLHLEKN